MLSADRLKLHSGATPGDAPVVLVEKRKGALRIAAVDARASALSITPGLPLADARARIPEIAAIDHDPVADRLLLERIANDCDRYSPMVALDASDGVTMDITGCTHGFGGERQLAAAVGTRLGDHGFQVRLDLADTALAAQALARFRNVLGTDEAHAIRQLPVTALRLSGETELALARAGLKTIGDLADRPSAPLSARFGEAMTTALAQLLGRFDSRIAPRRLPPALLFERRFAEPVTRTDFMLTTLKELAEEAAREMTERAKGGRRFAARLFRSDGQVRDLAVETSLPVRDPAAVMRLFRDRIESLSDPIDPGFGFDLIRLAVPMLEPLGPLQLHLEGGDLADGELSALIDRLSTRLGRERFRRMHPRDTHIPEQAVLALPAVEAAKPTPWIFPDTCDAPLRPIHLFDPPQAIEVIAEVPDGPPHRFRWRRALHEVLRCEGPERIAAEWWKRDDNAGLTRDYYRIEDVRGRRFWIFRHGLYASEKPDPGWYLHGLFA